MIHYRKCFTKYCTDGIGLFNQIFLKTPTMFNIFENQDSLFKIIDFIHSLVRRLQLQYANCSDINTKNGRRQIFITHQAAKQLNAVARGHTWLFSARELTKKVVSSTRPIQP